MEDNYKIRVGITHGDINGVGYEVILKTFSDPTMLELCTPIIYGSPKVAAYHRKAMDIQTNFSIVNSADDAQTVGYCGRFDNLDECRWKSDRLQRRGRFLFRS